MTFFLKVSFKLSCKSYEIMHSVKSFSHAYAQVYVWHIWVQFIMMSLQNSRWYFWYWYLKLLFRNNDTFLVNFVVGVCHQIIVILFGNCRDWFCLYCLSLQDYTEGEFIVNWQFFMGQVSP